MNWLISNWGLLLAALAGAGAAVIWIVKFIKLPKEQQLANVRKWLLWAVCQAEKELGGGTGQLKLVKVYDMFVAQFPVLAEWVTFEAFSGMVDEALEEMRGLLERNKSIARILANEP